jgi:hypothetical protein
MSQTIVTADPNANEAPAMTRYHLMKLTMAVESPLYVGNRA